MAWHPRHELPALPLALVSRRGWGLAKQVAVAPCLRAVRPEGATRPAVPSSLAQVAQQLEASAAPHDVPRSAGAPGRADRGVDGRSCSEQLRGRKSRSPANKTTGACVTAAAVLCSCFGGRARAAGRTLPAAGSLRGCPSRAPRAVAWLPAKHCCQRLGTERVVVSPGVCTRVGRWLAESVLHGLAR